MPTLSLSLDVSSREQGNAEIQETFLPSMTKLDLKKKKIQSAHGSVLSLSTQDLIFIQMSSSV